MTARSSKSTSEGTSSTPVKAADSAPGAVVTETSMGVARRFWATSLVRGALFLVVGLAMFLWMDIALDLVKWLLAIVLVLQGAVLALDYYRLLKSPRLEDEPGVWRLALAVAAVVAGLAILIWPNITVVWFLRVVAIWALISGVLGAISAYRGMQNRRPAWDWEMAISALWIVFGVLVLIKQLEDLPTAVVGLSVYLVVTGIVLLVSGWSEAVAAKNTARDATAALTAAAALTVAAAADDLPTPPTGYALPPVSDQPTAEHQRGGHQRGDGQR